MRESGLSVGAICTYFNGKDELFRQSCDLISAQGLDGAATILELMLAAATTADRPTSREATRTA